MIERHHEHSFDLDLLKPGDWALDVGCRGFAIPKMLMELGINVFAADPDPAVTPSIESNGSRLVFRHVAVIGQEIAANRKLTTFHLHPTDQQAHTTVRPLGGRTIKVPTTSIGAIRDELGIPQFGLLKLDCEGAEYGIMQDVTWCAKHGGAIARQISVEYHDHCGLSPEADMERWYARIHNGLAPFYEITRHQRQQPPWGGSPHYIDSLYTLRRELWKL